MRKLMIEAVAVEDIISEDHGTGFIPDKAPPDGKGLCQAFRLFLHSIGEMHTERFTITEEFADAGRIHRCTDDQHIPDTCKHERAKRIIDHWFVVNRQKLLACNKCEGIKTRPGTAGKKNPFHASSPFD